MSFKIVQTIEPGRKVPSLCVVPCAWEKNNTLYWPNTRKISVLNKLVQNAASKPEAEWLTQPCIKKRENFFSYEAAEKEMDEMTKRSDTESEIDEYKTKNKRQKTIRHSDFNSFIEESSNKENTDVAFTAPTIVSDLLLNQQRVMPETTSVQLLDVPGPSLISNLSNVGVSSAKNFILMPENNDQEVNLQDNQYYNIPILENTTAIADDKVNLILQNQREILNRQDQIIKELAAQKTRLEYICEVLGNNHQESLPEVRLNQNKQNEEELFNFLPINTPELLNKFEQDLHKEDYKDKLINKMSTVCGTSGKMNGINCCYSLIDCIITRDLLTKYSWSGGSRTTTEKFCFKNYRNIIKAFHTIIFKADSSFSELSVQNFFKSIVKNAKRRASLPCLRASQGKRRPKNLHYKQNKTLSEIATVERNDDLEQEEEVVEREDDGEENSEREEEDERHDADDEAD